MRRVIAALKQDISFQLRHGFYHAYAIVSLLYIIILKVIPQNLREYAAIMIIFSDPVLLGFFFVGGLVILERGQNLLQYLFVTPFRLYEYFLAKVVSLAFIALLSSLLIVFAVFGLEVNIFSLLVGVFLSSVFFTLVGLAFSAKAATINEYLLISPIFIVPFFLPILDFWGLIKSPIFYLLPGYGCLVLISGGFLNVGIEKILIGLVGLMVWSVIGYFWAKNWFNKYIIIRGGGVKE